MTGKRKAKVTSPSCRDELDPETRDKYKNNSHKTGKTFPPEKKTNQEEKSDILREDFQNDRLQGENFNSNITCSSEQQFFNKNSSSKGKYQNNLYENVKNLSVMENPKDKKKLSGQGEELHLEIHDLFQGKPSTSGTCKTSEYSKVSANRFLFYVKLRVSY